MDERDLTRRGFVTQVLGAAAGSLLVGRPAAEGATLLPMAGRPNILYVIMEDINPALGCYGQPLVRTPHVDRFASEGIRFSRAYCTAPVCSASRSAIFTGCYQTFIGCHQHRTAERNKRPLPPPVRHLCDWFRDAGYFTCNLHPPKAEMAGKPFLFGERGCGKIDLNMAVDHPHRDNPFDGRDWNERRPGQSFFAHITIYETHKGPGWQVARRQPASELVDPKSVPLPPYWPDHPVARDEFANYLDVIHLCDGYVGRLLDRLEREGLADSTIVVIGSDHGANFHGKQFLYDDGMQVPLMIRFPDRRNAGRVDDRLVSSVDLAPTLLGFAGIRPPPGAMQGRDLFDPAAPPRDCVFAARDRMDIAIDRMRAVRTDRYKYIRNDLPAVAYMQHNPYKERFYPTWNLVKELYAAGRLDRAQANFAQPVKAIEELYDLQADPWEVTNLAADSSRRSVLEELRGRVDRWVRDTDRGKTYEDIVEVYRDFSHGGQKGAEPA